jgi:arabinose-5-phosphate isomerase
MAMWPATSARNLVDQPIDAIMTRNPKTIAPTALASTAMAILNKNSIGALMVTDQSLITDRHCPFP